MKLRYVVIVLGVSLCISLIVSGLALSSSSRSKSTQTDTMAQLLPVALEHEDIPLYSGADDVKVDKVYKREWRYTTYHATTPPGKVIEFYKEKMPTNGWVLQWE